jgi:hypothetical protein
MIRNKPNKLVNKLICFMTRIKMTNKNSIFRPRVARNPIFIKLILKLIFRYNKIDTN